MGALLRSSSERCEAPVGPDSNVTRLIRDRDGTSGAAFDAWVRNLGIAGRRRNGRRSTVQRVCRRHTYRRTSSVWYFHRPRRRLGSERSNLRERTLYEC